MGRHLIKLQAWLLGSCTQAGIVPGVQLSALQALYLSDSGDSRGGPSRHLLWWLKYHDREPQKGPRAVPSPEPVGDNCWVLAMEVTHASQDFSVHSLRQKPALEG